MTPPSPTATAVVASAKATLKQLAEALPVERGAQVAPPSPVTMATPARADR